MLLYRRQIAQDPATGKTLSVALFMLGAESRPHFLASLVTEGPGITPGAAQDLNFWLEMHPDPTSSIEAIVGLAGALGMHFARREDMQSTITLARGISATFRTMDWTRIYTLCDALKREQISNKPC